MPWLLMAHPDLHLSNNTIACITTHRKVLRYFANLSEKLINDSDYSRA